MDKRNDGCVAITSTLAVGHVPSSAWKSMQNYKWELTLGPEGLILEFTVRTEGPRGAQTAWKRSDRCPDLVTLPC